MMYAVARSRVDVSDVSANDNYKKGSRKISQITIEIGSRVESRMNNDLN